MHSFNDGNWHVLPRTRILKKTLPDPPAEQGEDRQHPKCRKSYTVERQLAAISKYYQCGSNVSRVSKESSMLRGCLQQWLKQRPQLEAMHRERQVSVKKRRIFPQDHAATVGRCHFSPQLEAISLSGMYEWDQDIFPAHTGMPLFPGV